MDKKQEKFLDHVLEEVLVGIPKITSRPMFGGYGIYNNGTIFAIIAFGKLYFKVDDSTRPMYEAMKSEPFTYEQGDHERTTMPYWLVPEELFKEKEKIRKMVTESVSISKKTSKSSIDLVPEPVFLLTVLFTLIGS